MSAPAPASAPTAVRPAPRFLWSWALSLLGAGAILVALPENAWLALLGALRDDDGTSSAIRLAVVTTALLLTGLSLLLLACTRARTAGALRALRAAVQEVADGDFAGQLPEPRIPELQPLVCEANRILEDLRASRRELQRSNRNLQAVVEARTRDSERSERKYRSVIGQATVGILLWDPGSLEIIEVNAKAAELLGWRPRDLVGSSVAELFPAAERAARMRALQRVAEVGAVRVDESTLEGNRGGPFPAELTASLVRFGDEVVVLGMVRDLTRAKETERRTRLLHEQVRLTERMASIGRLAAGVAHEINNPMGYVASNVNRLVEYGERLDTLLGTLPLPDAAGKVRREVEELTTDLREAARDTGEGVHRVSEIVRALREFSHGGQSSAGYGWTDLNPVIRNCLTLLHNELKHRADVQLELSPLPRIRCDPRQIGQLLMNLIANAAQALRERGTITIQSSASGDCVHLAVEDDGCGVRPEHLDRIFEPFFTTKPVGQGTGLGLAVSREIARRHAGQLWVDSRLDCGTRFVVELPLEGPPEDPQQDDSDPAPA